MGRVGKALAGLRRKLGSFCEFGPAAFFRFEAPGVRISSGECFGFDPAVVEPLDDVVRKQHPVARLCGDAYLTLTLRNEPNFFPMQLDPGTEHAIVWRGLVRGDGGTRGRSLRRGKDWIAAESDRKWD